MTDPTGRVVYGGSYYGVYVFTSDGVTGRLTYPLTCCSNEYAYGYGYGAGGVAYYGMAMHPSGKFIFAARASGSNKLDAYLVDGGNGGLTLAGSYATGAYPYTVAVDPTGKFVYVGNEGDSLRCRPTRWMRRPAG